MTRNKLKALRPLIPTISEMSQISPSEHFQNTCLRPILKFQHDLLVALFNQYISKHKDTFSKGNVDFKMTYIKNAVQKDRDLKNQLLGCIIGQFTLDEFQIFVADEKENKKRLVGMLVQRLQSQYQTEVSL